MEHEPSLHCASRRSEATAPNDGTPPLYAFLDTLEEKQRQKIFSLLALLLQTPETAMREPYVKHFGIERYRALYELRAKRRSPGRTGSAPEGILPATRRDRAAACTARRIAGTAAGKCAGGLCAPPHADQAQLLKIMDAFRELAERKDPQRIFLLLSLQYDPHPPDNAERLSGLGGS